MHYKGDSPCDPISTPLQASEKVAHEAEDFSGLDRLKERLAAEKKDPAQTNGTSQPLEACDHKILIIHAQIFCHPVSHISHHLCSFACPNIFVIQSVTCLTISTPLQTKKKLQKFMDSIVQKSGKIRALLRDVGEEYSQSDMMSRHYIDGNICACCMFNLQYPSGSPCSVRCMAMCASTILNNSQVLFFSCQAGKDS